VSVASASPVPSLTTVLHEPDEGERHRPQAIEPAELSELARASIPHVTIHAFCETEAFEQVWRAAAADRRLAATTTSVHAGGFAGALETYGRRKTPDLVIIESSAPGEQLVIDADALAEFCDPETRVILVGHRNDIQIYRKLVNMGVSNYLVAPAGVAAIIGAIAEIYAEPGKEKIGRIYAVLGAKGGVGASTVAQGVALELAERRDSDVLLVDLDLCFGSSSMNLSIEPNRGLSELIGQADRIDVTMLDRVLVRRGLHLNLLGGSARLDASRDLDEFTVERILEVAQTHLRHIVLDIPHLWSGWVERALSAADEVVVVATPELGSLRNAMALIERVTALRPNDPAPKLVLNQVGVPRRQEIGAKDIAAILKIEPALSVPFDPKNFSLAAARGKTVMEVARRSGVARAYARLAELMIDAGPTAAAARRPEQRQGRRWALLRRKAR
jgi:pilus assembly protein CpaE